MSTRAGRGEISDSSLFPQNGMVAAGVVQDSRDKEDLSVIVISSTSSFTPPNTTFAVLRWCCRKDGDDMVSGRLLVGRKKNWPTARTAQQQLPA